MRSRMRNGRRVVSEPATAAAYPGKISVKSERLQDVLVIAADAGLLKGGRTKTVRGRMPAALVNKAKARTGVKSDTDLLELALANLAVADEFPEWLLSQKATISKDLDLEF